MSGGVGRPYSASEDIQVSAEDKRYNSHIAGNAVDAVDGTNQEMPRGGCVTPALLVCFFVMRKSYAI